MRIHDDGFAARALVRYRPLIAAGVPPGILVVPVLECTLGAAILALGLAAAGLGEPTLHQDA